MVQPDLAGPEGAARGEVLAAGHVLAVGSPGRAVEQTERLFAERLQIAAVALHHPEIVAAPAIAGERDRAPLRPEARLHVPGHAAGERLRLPALHRDAVEP